MKKNIIIIVLVLIVIALSCLVIFKHDNHTYIKDTDMYQRINKDDINEIVIRYNGLVAEPIDPVELSEKKDIDEVFTALGNIEVLDKVNVKVMDSSMVIIVYTNELALEFNFEADFFITSDGNHATKGFEQFEELLKKYN